MKLVWFIVGIVGLILTFRPFNAIVFWIASVVLNIVLDGKSWYMLQIVYFSLSFFLFLYCIFSCFAGYIHPFTNPVLKKYYCAIRWNMGSEMFSFWCSHFSLCNFLYSGFVGYYTGVWWLLALSVFYWLVYTYFIGEILNPYLFLGDRSAHGDLDARYELAEIMRIRHDIWTTTKK